MKGDDEDVETLYRRFESHDMPDHINMTYDDKDEVQIYKYNHNQVDELKEPKKASINDLLNGTSRLDKSLDVTDRILGFYYIWNMFFGACCIVAGTFEIYTNRGCYEFKDNMKSSENAFEIMAIITIAVASVLLVISIATFVTRMGYHTFIPVKYKHYNNQKNW